MVLFFKKELFLFLFLPFLALAEPDDDQGRDFPKTLIFDEPGIDDEVSLPTLIVLPRPGGHEADIDFELDKRLTTWLSIQINTGYTLLPRPDASAYAGWQNTSATLKSILFSDREAERLISFSLIREFGGSGAARIGALPVASTTGAVNFGQGFAPLRSLPLVQPFAVTGSGGFLISDTLARGSAREGILSLSVQYSFAVLAETGPGARLPAVLRPFLPIVEFSDLLPASSAAERSALVAPGLIYAGEGYQLAAEALIPLTRAAGSHAGAIAQINISLVNFGVPALAHPVLAWFAGQ